MTPEVRLPFEELKFTSSPSHGPFLCTLDHPWIVGVGCRNLSHVLTIYNTYLALLVFGDAKKTVLVLYLSWSLHNHIMKV